MFEGRDITGLGVTRVCQLGLTKSYQVNQLFTRLTVRENVAIAALAAAARAVPRSICCAACAACRALPSRSSEALDLVRLTARADTPVSELAYGEKRRLEIGLALAIRRACCCSTSRSPA